ncbi:MAG: hypothetical protein QM783_06970 [Phycisphaerales bacterium]
MRVRLPDPQLVINVLKMLVTRPVVGESDMCLVDELAERPKRESLRTQLRSTIGWRGNGVSRGDTALAMMRYRLNRHRVRSSAFDLLPLSSFGFRESADHYERNAECGDKHTRNHSRVHRDLDFLRSWTQIKLVATFVHPEVVVSEIVNDKERECRGKARHN